MRTDTRVSKAGRQETPVSRPQEMGMGLPRAIQIAYICVTNHLGIQAS